MPYRYTAYQSITFSLSLPSSSSSLTHSTEYIYFILTGCKFVSHTNYYCIFRISGDAEFEIRSVRNLIPLKENSGDVLQMK